MRATPPPAPFLQPTQPAGRATAVRPPAAPSRRPRPLAKPLRPVSLALRARRLSATCATQAKQLYILQTTAIDSGNMKFILDSMIHIVEKENLAAYERLG